MNFLITIFGSLCNKVIDNVPLDARRCPQLCRSRFYLIGVQKAQTTVQATPPPTQVKSAADCSQGINNWSIVPYECAVLLLCCTHVKSCIWVQVRQWLFSSFYWAMLTGRDYPRTSFCLHLVKAAVSQGKQLKACCRNDIRVTSLFIFLLNISLLWLQQNMQIFYMVWCAQSDIFIHVIVVHLKRCFSFGQNPPAGQWCKMSPTRHALYC